MRLFLAFVFVLSSIGAVWSASLSSLLKFKGEVCYFLKPYTGGELDDDSHRTLPTTSGVYFTAAKTDAQGRTRMTFHYRDNDGELKTVEYNGPVGVLMTEFVYAGQSYDVVMDGCTCQGWHQTVQLGWSDGYVHYNVAVQGASDGAVEVPVAWRKARTLTGVLYGYADNDRPSVITIKCGKANRKGVAKVSAVVTQLNGKKTSLKAQSVDVSSDQVEMSWPAEKIESLTIEGDSFWCSGAHFSGYDVPIGGAVRRSAYFPFDYLPEMIEGVHVLYPYEEEPVEMAGTKWICAKAASMRWEKASCINGVCTSNGPGSWRVDTSRGRTNISGLKLSYNAKTGNFKGQYTVYLWATGGKKLKVSVTGFVIDGYAYGLATLKKPALTWPIEF